MPNKKIKSIAGALFSASARFDLFARRGWYDRLPDEKYICKKFKAKLGYTPNLNRPETFNEKLQWLKLHDRRQEYVTMVDKYEAKEYVSSVIGSSHIIKTLGVWDRFDDIDLGALPDQFVIKCTHDSGGLVIVKDKQTMNRQAAKEKIEKCMRKNYYYAGREWPYLNVRPRIIAEQFMQDDNGGDIQDYKVHCFNGEPKVILVCRERFSKQGMTEDFFDTDWRHLNVKRENHGNAAEEIVKPAALGEMLELAGVLSRGIPFIRVDFYVISGTVYFGELTLYPASGFAPFVPEAFDREMGQWIRLPAPQNV